MKLTATSDRNFLKANRRRLYKKIIYMEKYNYYPF